MNTLAILDDLVNGDIHDEMEMTIEELDTARGRMIENEIDDGILARKECEMCNAYQSERVAATCPIHSGDFEGKLSFARMYLSDCIEEGCIDLSDLEGLSDEALVEMADSLSAEAEWQAEM